MTRGTSRPARGGNANHRLGEPVRGHPHSALGDAALLDTGAKPAPGRALPKARAACRRRGR
ncbi:hypothetical protein N5T08_04630 [Escherichia coli]|nr:hypothetical protein [Escherichia coli]MCW3333299.1 hypothetical protein [Escherichia coli]